MILAKRRTKLSSGYTIVEKVTKSEYKDKLNYYYYVELHKGRNYVSGNDSEKIPADKAIKIIKELNDGN